MTRFSTLIFDLDGTLIDSAPAILASFRDAFAAARLTPARAITPDIIGPPLRETLQMLSGHDDAATLDTLTEHFKSAYDGEGLKQTAAYDGVADMLERLHSQGTALHIATNKRLHPTLKILDLLGWRDWFSSVYALDIVTPRLPTKAAMIARQLEEQAIDVQQTAYIGDRREDGDAAAANALPFFAATWGYGSLEPHELQPDWQVATQPAELLRALGS